MHFKTPRGVGVPPPARSVSAPVVGAYAKQRPSAKTRNAGPRPLGRPASDLSMYYDRRLAAPTPAAAPRGGSEKGKKRVGLGGSADLERRRGARQADGTWTHTGMAAPYGTNHRLDALVSPQLTRRQHHQQRPPPPPYRSDPSLPHPRDLGLLRSQTIAELRPPRVNLTGVTTGQLRPRPEFTRTASWCATTAKYPRSTSRFSSSSTSSLPLIASAEGHGDAVLHASCDGLLDRVSTLRSLANNPRFKVSIVNGSPRISPRSHTSQKTPDDVTSHRLKTQGDVTVQLSRHGYHLRSQSPTYRKLIDAKDQLSAELCKQLRAIRRQLEGQKARENSAIEEGLRPGESERESEEWYAEMMRRETENEEQDGGIIETMSAANTGDPLRGFESLDLSSARPHFEIKFDPVYLQRHINDADILGIDVDEEERRVVERRDRDKRRRKHRARSKSPTHFRRTCEACCVGGTHAHVEKPRVEYLRTNKSRRVKLRKRVKKDDSDDSDSYEPESQSGILEAVSEKPPVRILPPPSPLPKLNKSKKRGKARTNSSKSSKSKASSVDNIVSKASSDTGSFGNEPSEVGSKPALEDEAPSSPKEPQPSPQNHSHPVSEHRSESTLGPTDPSPTIADGDPTETEGEPIAADGEPKEEKAQLTDKEKFLLMRKRMQERQQEKLQKRESFIDYSMIAFAGSRKDRAGRGEKGLGNTLSSRLESMATFKSKKDPQNGTRTSLLSMLDSDEDDDESDDDDDDDSNDDDDD